MASKERPLRADAERNRRRVLDAAAEMFRERGLDVGVAEIAQRAGVGRGTLFRNFPTKDDLIAAIVVDRMQEAIADGRRLRDSGDPGAALFEFIDDLAGRQQLDRALFEAVGDQWVARGDIRDGQAELLGVIGELLTRAQDAGAVRTDVEPMDVLMLLKGVCEVASAFSIADPAIVERQLDFVRIALSVAGAGQPLRGRAPTVQDYHNAHSAPTQRAAG